MASEWLLKKAREEYVPEEARELTPAEKRRNWWYYNKWTVLLVLAGVLIAGRILCAFLGIGVSVPDLSVAYISDTPLNEADAERIQDGLAALCGDLNGDGVAKAELCQYIAPFREDSPGSYLSYSAQLRLSADLSEEVSCFFITDDPDTLQEVTQILRNLDGSAPDKDDLSAQGKYVRWADSSRLLTICSSPELCDLAFARRILSSRNAARAEAYDDVWDLLTADAAQE